MPWLLLERTPSDQTVMLAQYCAGKDCTLDSPGEQRAVSMSCMKTVLVTCRVTAGVVEGLTAVRGEVLLSGAFGRAAMVPVDGEELTSNNLVDLRADPGWQFR